MLSFDLLQAASEVAYDERLHAGLLEKVWSVAFPGEAFKRVSDKWKHIGFQQCDPVSDLRGSGVLGLTHLSKFIENYQGSQSLSYDFPLAIASINVTAMLLSYLG